MAKLSDSNVLVCGKPASFSANRWLEASFTGNGKVGASLLGAYSNEAILINHTALKHRGYTGVLQDVSDKFPLVRKYYNDVKLFDAEKLLSSEFEKRGYKPMPEQPLPLCVLNISFFNEGYITDYTRTTDMNSGEVGVNFKAGSTNISRGLFVARGSDIIAYNASKSGSDKFNVMLGISTVDGNIPQNSVFKYEGGFMYFSARNANGLDYGIVARVVTSTGTAEHIATGIALKASDGFNIFAKTFVNSSRDTEFKSIKAELSALKVSYDKMLSSHEAAHRKLYNNATLELASDSKQYELGALIDQTGGARLDANLIERLYNFGKFLAVCGGGMITPAGLWCGDLKCGNGFLNLNNTAQLLYSGITKSVAEGSILELFEYYEKHVDDLKKNSARIFGVGGYFVPSVISPDSALLGSTSAQVIHFIASSALAANLFYNYYLASGDLKILKGRILPFMREVFDFYSDYLKVDSHGTYSTIPSFSPTSTPGNTIQGKPLSNFAFATNSTIDFLAFGNLLDNLIEAATLCGTAAGEIPMWRDMKTKIPKYMVADTGAIREYTNSAFIDNPNNCGCMHSYGLWPLKNFSFSDHSVNFKSAVDRNGQIVESSITLKKASANAIILRLNRASNLQNAASLAVYAAQLAHAGDAINVKNLLMRLVASCFTESGACLTNDWRGGGFTHFGVPNLDISGNIGFATAIAECIVQSNSTNLKILPAAFAELGQGTIKDIATDFGARVSVDWDTRKARCTVRITPRTNCKINVLMPHNFKRIKNKEISYDSNACMISGLQLVAGKTVTLDF